MDDLSIRGRNFLGYEIEIGESVTEEQIKEFLDSRIVKNIDLFKNSILTIKLKQNRKTDFLLKYLKTYNIFVNAIFIENSKIDTNNIPTVVQEAFKHSNSVVFKGNLRSGQTLESDDNLIILGNVNRDSYIYAKKNIFVLGTLEGIPHAGFQSNKDTFVFAFRINSPQIRIFDILAKAPGNIKENSTKEPEVAFVENSQIIILKYKDWLNYKME